MTPKDKPTRGGARPFDREKRGDHEKRGDRDKKGPGVKPAPLREKAVAKKPPVAAAEPETGAAKPERISKIMARAGVASRRDIERMIMEGRVSLNGKVLDTPVVNATLSDTIEVDGVPIRGIERTRLWLFHKPAGLVTTNSDPEGRPTVFDNLPEGLPRVLSIGRLDINTEGLLLLTNDGGLSRVLELPATGWLRRYRVRAHGEIDQAELDKLKDGIAVDGVLYGSIEATLDRNQGRNVWITMALREGKNREIKNVLGALGLEVNRLIRISYGPFQLGDLPEGEVVEVRGRTLRDQLGPRLIEEAGANFEAPLYNNIAVEEDDEKPAGKPDQAARSEWTARADKPSRSTSDKFAGKFADKGDRREMARDRLDTKRDDRKSAGKDRFESRGRDEGRASDKPKRPAMGTSRTANVWMAPGARPTVDGKSRHSARAEADRLFSKPTGSDDERLRVQVKRAEEDKDWIRADQPDRSPRDGERGFGGKRAFGDRPDRGERSDRGDRKPRAEGERAFGDRAGGRKSFSDKPPGARSRDADGGADRKRSFDKRPERDDRPARAERPQRDFQDRAARSERPFGERSEGPRKPRAEGDRPARSGKPFAAEGRSERAPGERPFGGKPRGAKPFGAKPPGAKSFGAKPGGKSFGGKPSGSGSGEGRSFSGKPRGERPDGDNKPSGGGDRPGGAGGNRKGMTRGADRRR